MCAISGSFNTAELRNLVTLNSYRGQHSHSISYYNCRDKTINISRKMGPLDLADINIPEGHYGICHTQAPTTSAKDESSIHPATVTTDVINALWHNGIIKDKDVKRLQQVYDTPEEWDTKLILHQLIKKDTPNDIDGTFSCLWYKTDKFGNGKLFLFRNELSPMFVDDFLNISSTKFEGSYPTEPNKIFWMDTDFETLIEKDTFRTTETPYFYWD